MAEFIQLIKYLKPGKSYPANKIDVTVNEKDIEAIYYSIYGDRLDSRQDGIYEKEIYNVQQLNTFLNRKLKDGFIKLNQNEEHKVFNNYMDKIETAISENQDAENEIDKLVQEGQNKLKELNQNQNQNTLQE